MGNKNTNTFATTKSPSKKKTGSHQNSGIKASSSGSSLVAIEHNQIIGNMMKRVYHQSDEKLNSSSKSQQFDGLPCEIDSGYPLDDEYGSNYDKKEVNGYSRFFGSQSPNPSGAKNNPQQSLILFSGKSSFVGGHSPEDKNLIKSSNKSNNHSPMASMNGSMSMSVSENVGGIIIRDNTIPMTGMPDGRKNGTVKNQKDFLNFQEKFFELSNEIIYMILSFVIDNYNKLILVSPFWYFKIHEVLDDVFLRVDNNFIQKNLRLLTLKKSYLSYTPFEVSKKSYRLDRNIVAEILPYYRGKTVIMGFTYQLKGNKRKEKMQAEYKFDVIKEGSAKSIWIYKEVCKHNFDAINYGFIQAIMPVCVGDNVKIAINFYNLSGLIDIDSIEWHDPIIQNTPTLPKQINPKIAQTVDKNRICEIEEIQHEWSMYEYFENKEKKRLDLFTPQLLLKETFCSGVDIITSKMLYHANCPGKVKDSLKEMGVEITIVPHKDELTTEIKRAGLYSDLENHLEIRPGDSLTFYLSCGD